MAPATSASPAPTDAYPTSTTHTSHSRAVAPSQLPPLHPHHHHRQRLPLPARQPPPNPINLPSPAVFARSSPSTLSPSLSLSPSPSGAPSPMSTRSPPPPTPDPSTKLPPLAHHDGDGKTLPSLSSITGSQPPVPFRSDRPADHAAMAPSNWSPASLNATMPYRQPPQQPSRADSPATMDLDGSNSGTSVTSANSPDRQHEGTPSSVNLDDPDVRLAAEALGDLRADFVSSPPDSSGPMSPPPTTTQALQPAQKKPNRPEPLLSLLTTAHPLVASTIGGASSAYGGVKNFSPRFKSSAEYVEGYLTPIAKTVNRVGRRTGVEGGVRWFLGTGRRHEAPTSDPDSAGNSKKRRKVAGDDTNDLSDDVPGNSDISPPTPKSARRLSSTSTIDTLPAYDEQRSPAYTEDAVAPPATSSAQNQAWQTRLLMSTSGLSVAMSAESLRSLKYCLRWLRWTNDHMGKAIGSLKDALAEYETACNPQAKITNGDGEDEPMGAPEGGSGTKTPEEARTEIANRIQVIKADILKTLQEVTNTVSKYAGGALPENARILVRRHLTSLPQRFRLATMSENGAGSGTRDGDSSLRDGAQKVLVLAKEGLDMVTQISGVLDGTIVSAEEWCERMGKRRPSEREDSDAALPTEKLLPPPMEANGDVKMG